MSTPARALAALATAAPLAITTMGVGARAAAAPAGSPPHADGPHCATRVLSATELDAGAHSTVVCAETDADARAALDGPARTGAVTAAADVVLAVHYDVATGASIQIVGSACDGGGISFGAGDYWNDRIDQTRHLFCSQVKHWVDANYQGASQNTTGGYYQLVGLNGTLANRVSSIRYYGPTN